MCGERGGGIEWGWSSGKYKNFCFIIFATSGISQSRSHHRRRRVVVVLLFARHVEKYARLVALFSSVFTDF